jgi:hypothetical protein
MNGHAKSEFENEKHTDLAVLSQRVEDSLSVIEEAARCLKILNRTRSEIREAESKVVRFDEMEIALAKSEQENMQLKKQIGDRDAVLGLVREPVTEYLNDQIPLGRTVHIIADALGLM